MQQEHARTYRIYTIIYPWNQTYKQCFWEFD